LNHVVFIIPFAKSQLLKTREITVLYIQNIHHRPDTRSGRARSRRKWGAAETKSTQKENVTRVRNTFSNRERGEIGKIKRSHAVLHLASPRKVSVSVTYGGVHHEGMKLIEVGMK
jgi:hypothetical protein